MARSPEVLSLRRSALVRPDGVLSGRVRRREARRVLLEELFDTSRDEANDQIDHALLLEGLAPPFPSFVGPRLARVVATAPRAKLVTVPADTAMSVFVRFVVV